MLTEVDFEIIIDCVNGCMSACTDTGRIPSVLHSKCVDVKNFTGNNHICVFHSTKLVFHTCVSGY